MIILTADIWNPAQFLGSCGFLELAHILRPGVLSHWTVEGLNIAADEQLFSGVISLIDRLNIKLDDSWSGSESERPFSIVDRSTGTRLRMDWWETRDGSGGSRWKCFSGQMSAAGTTEKMLMACKTIAVKVTADNIFSLSERISGRLNFDPRSAWDAVEIGFAPNDHAALRNAVTFPFSEFLTAVAVQTLPLSEQKGGDTPYFVWFDPLPLPIARVVAAQSLEHVATEEYTFGREHRSKALSYLTFSRKMP